ncbi:ExbD/TolR family protein [Magnetococcales bacterium HHB-1]
MDNLTPNSEDQVSIPLGLTITPLVDLVFLLLVFFLLTSHFVEEKQIDIRLPQAESSSEIEQDDPLTLTIDKKGHVFLKTQVFSTEDKPRFIKSLQEELNKREEKQVMIRADQKGSVEKLVWVIDAARKAGALGVDLTTEKP